MAKYVVRYGQSFEVELGELGEIVGHLRARHLAPGTSEDVFRRRVAMEMCEWNGGVYYFGSNEMLGLSMIEYGLLEKLSA